jgi:hypothetical protein
MLTALSLLGWWHGDLDTSLVRSAEALELARQLDHPSTSGYAIYHAALLRLWREEPEAARELAVWVIDLADGHELGIWSAVGTVVLGAASTALGIGDEGLRWVSEGLERYRGLRTPPVFWPFLLQILATASRQGGRSEAGLAAAREGLSLAPFLPELHLIHGDLLADTGDPAAAAAAYLRGAEAAGAWGAATSELRAAVRLGRLEGAGEEARAAARTRLAALLPRFTEGLGSPDLAAAHEVLGQG